MRISQACSMAEKGEEWNDSSLHSQASDETQKINEIGFSPFCLHG